MAINVATSDRSGDRAKAVGVRALAGDDLKRMFHAVMKASDATGVTIQQFNEAANGQLVFHTHFHVVPRHDCVGLEPRTGEMADNEVLAANVEKIRAALEEQ